MANMSCWKGVKTFFLLIRSLPPLKRNIPPGWPKNPVRVKKESIAEISCTGPEGVSYVFERNGKDGEFKLTFPSPGPNVDRAVLQSSVQRPFFVSDRGHSTSKLRPARAHGRPKPMNPKKGRVWHFQGKPIGLIMPFLTAWSTMYIPIRTVRNRVPAI